MSFADELKGKVERCFDKLQEHSTVDGCPYLLPSWLSGEERAGLLWLTEVLAKMVSANPKHKNFDRAAQASKFFGLLTMHGRAMHEVMHLLQEELADVIEGQQERIRALEVRCESLQVIVDSVPAPSRAEGSSGDEAGV